VRINVPVTNIERHLQDGEYIVSKTDLKGQITYVNSSFMGISGFAEEELLGKAHNIVRHPDMPPAAYADLWRTLQRGKPWRGLVKNRCKNGDHYWSRPMPIQFGKIIGLSAICPCAPSLRAYRWKRRSGSIVNSEKERRAG